MPQVSYALTCLTICQRGPIHGQLIGRSLNLCRQPSTRNLLKRMLQSHATNSQYSSIELAWEGTASGKAIETNVADEFCEAALLPSNINRPDSTSDCPCLSKDKLTLWFSSDRTDGYGSHDLWFSHRDSLNSPWQDPINPGESVNSNAYEQSPFLSDDELTLLFSRAGENGVFQIYEARRTHRERPF